MIKCKKCNWKGYKEDLKIINNHGGIVIICPNCKKESDFKEIKRSDKNE